MVIQKHQIPRVSATTLVVRASAAAAEAASAKPLKPLKPQATTCASKVMWKYCMGI